MARSFMALAAEFLRWRDHIDVRILLNVNRRLPKKKKRFHINVVILQIVVQTNTTEGIGV